MATIPGQLSVEITDSLGVTTTMPTWHEVTTTSTIADLNTWAAAYLPKLDALTDGLIGDVTMSLKLTKPGTLKTAPVEDCEVEKTALFNFAQAGVPWKYGIDVPAISNNALNLGHINLEAAAVTDWISILTTLTNGIGGVSKFFLALGALLDALITFRKHRKAQSRRSLTVPGA